MRTLRILLLVTFFVSSAFAQKIDSWRTPVDNDILPWRYCGFQGNVTNQPPYFPVIANAVTQFGAVAGGISGQDNSTAWSNALAAAVASLSTNSGACVYWPAGVYKITNAIAIPSNISIRGDGPTKTVFLSNFAGITSGGRGDAPIIAGMDVTRNTTAVNSGYTRGSYSLIVASTTGLKAGQLVRMYQNPDTNYILQWQVMTSNSVPQPQGQMFVITNVNTGSGTIGIDSPIIDTNWQSSLNPTLDAFVNPVTNFGLESLSISNYNTGNQSYYNIYFFNAYNFWINNVRSTNSLHANVEFDDCYQGIIMHSDTWFHSVYDGNAREGIKTQERSTRLAIVDCLAEAGNTSVMFQYDCGNFAGYNFASIGLSAGGGSSDFAGGMSTHGFFAHYDCFEGCIAPWLPSHDNTWGDNKTCMNIRDWGTSDGWGDVFGTQEFNIGNFSVFLDATNRYHMMLGCILQTTRDSGQAGPYWSVGYDRAHGNNYPSTPADPAALPSFTLFGNLNMNNGKYTNVNYTTSGTISNSVAYPSAPWFFNGIYNGVNVTNLAWPPIGPDVALTGWALTNTPVTPSMWRRFYGTNVFQDPQIATPPANQNVAVGGSATFTAGINGSSQAIFQWRKNGNPIAGATQSTYTINPVHVSDTGAYSVVVTNQAGWTLSGQAQLSLLAVRKTY